MFQRLLIANRGEIAVRIARTAHRLGVSTVGVHSETDRSAVHVGAVDLSVALGGATAAASYLRVDAIVEAALRTGCDAVHPGYGFLAESPALARAVEEVGLSWVGPTAAQIELLGDKVAAKVEAAAAGVPTTDAVVVAPGRVPAEVAGMELPVVVKAAAGGGGRGMRVVHDRADLEDAVAAAAREAAAAFGDPTVFVEPWIGRGRHVEVQVLGDHHGDVVHLGERECSIQRRHQKLVEEAPSPGIDESTRTALCDAAVALARRVGYRNAGTVEFLVGPPARDGRLPTIAFLEVNTRLQVEHPVTEEVWGVDLVELQLRVAAGEPLPFAQDDLSPRGHAIEVRLVAEDPAAGWLPSTGTLAEFAVDGARVDSGVAAGSEVGADYDSLLAKVIAAAPRRGEAAASLARSLRSARIAGVRTNADMLAATLVEADFLAGRTSTAYLDDHPALAAARGPEGDDRLAHLVAAALSAEAEARAADRLWGFAPSGWRNVPGGGRRVQWADDADGSVHDLEYRCLGRSAGGRRFEVRLGPPPEPGESGALGPDARRVLDVVVPAGGGAVRVVEVDGIASPVVVDGHGSAAGPVTTVSSAAGRTAWRPVPRFVTHDSADAVAGPVSPLPGTVVSVHVGAGDEVADGDLLVVVEAMKMEHRITARAGATVTEVLVGPGDRVDAGDLLVALH